MIQFKYEPVWLRIPVNKLLFIYFYAFLSSNVRFKGNMGTVSSPFQIKTCTSGHAEALFDSRRLNCDLNLLAVCCEQSRFF